MKELFDAILFAVGVTLPSVLLLGFGVVMRRTGQVDAAFAAKASRLVFNYGLPCLLFHELMSSEIRYGQEAVMLAAGVSTTLLLYLGAELYAWRFVPEVRDKGVFVQGVFRSNMAIMGLAFVQNAYGNAGLPSGAVYVGVVTLLYNVLSVITLSRSGARAGRRRWLHIGRNIVTNPLIVAIVSALLLQRLNIDLPRPVMQTARYMANIALPMALICAGATFDVRSVLDTSGISLPARIGRVGGARQARAARAELPSILHQQYAHTGRRHAPAEGSVPKTAQCAPQAGFWLVRWRIGCALPTHPLSIRRVRQVCR